MYGSLSCCRGSEKEEQGRGSMPRSWVVWDLHLKEQRDVSLLLRMKIELSYILLNFVWWVRNTDTIGPRYLSFLLDTGV